MDSPSKAHSKNKERIARKPLSFRRYFLLVAVFSIFAVNLITWSVYRITVADRGGDLKRYEQYIVNLKHARIRGLISSVVSDVRFIAHLPLTEQYANLPTGVPLDGSVETRLFSPIFVTFCQQKAYYLQLRFLDNDGQEHVRVNHTQMEPLVVARDNLQEKGDRYYFLESSNLISNEIYISRFDLNVENGVIERPFRPVIRVVTPVYTVNNERSGFVIANLCGDYLISIFRNFTDDASAGNLYFLNEEGYYISSPNTNDEWGFLPERTNKSNACFSRAYPSAWKRMTNSDKGQFTTKEGVFTFTAVEPGSAIDGEHLFSHERKWYIVSHFTKELWKANAHEGFPVFFGIMLLLTVTALVASYFVAHILRDREKAQRELVLAAATDPLTGIANRRTFLEVLTKEIERVKRTDQNIAIILGDVDLFKRVNDTYGHDVGDKVLVEIANTLTALIRPYDAVCRFGGEEFIIMLAETTREQAELKAESIRKGIEQHFFLHNGKDLPVTMSFGVSVYEAGMSLEKLISLADKALYKSKRRGRNKVTVVRR